MILSVNQLKKITKILVNHLYTLVLNEIALEEQDIYYYKIFHKDRDFDNFPQYSLGFLDEKIEYLKKITAETIVCYDLELLGMLFRTIGEVLEKNNFKNKNKFATLTLDELDRIIIIIFKYIDSYNTSNFFIKANDTKYQMIKLKDVILGEDPKITVGDIKDDQVKLLELVSGQRIPEYMDYVRLGSLFTVLGSILP